MRVTAISAKIERKRQDSSARSAEEQSRRSKTAWVRRRFRPNPSTRATEEAIRGKKHLSSGKVQAIFTSSRTPLGECRLL